MKQTLLLLCLLVICKPQLFSQIDWENPILQVTSYDGLPSTYYKGFAEDEFGFIWVATQKGICKFDGSQLHCLKDKRLPQHRFTSLVYDQFRKTMWIGTENGIYGYHLITEEVHRLKDNGVSRDNRILSLKIGYDGVLWVGTRNKFQKLNIGSDSLEIVHIPLGVEKGINNGYNEIYDIELDPNWKNRLWLASQVGVVIYDFEKGHFQEVERTIGNNDYLFINQIESDPKRSLLYFGIRNHADIDANYNYLIYDTKSSEVVDKILFDKNWVNKNISIYQDSLVMFSMSAGLVIYNPQTKEVIESPQNKTSHVPGYQANLVDLKGNLWLGTPEGVLMYNSSLVTGKSYYYSAEFPNWYHIVSDIKFDPTYRKAYLGTNGGEGLYEFDLETKQWKIYPSLHEDKTIRKTYYRDIYFQSDGELRIVDQNGFFKINDAGEIEKTNYSIEGETTWAISFVDSYETLWAINAVGFRKIDLKTKSVKDIRHDVHFCSVNSGEIEMFEDSNSDVWIGGLCEGFDVFRRATDTFYSFDLPELYKNTIIEFFHQKGKMIWAVNTNGVIFKINSEKIEDGIAEIIDIPQQIIDQKIQLLNSDNFDPSSVESGAFDRLGKFWMMSQQGVYRFDEERKELELFTKNVGVLVEDPDMNVYCAAFLNLLPDGKMLFTTRKGLCIFDPENISNESRTPKAYIAGITVNNQNLKKDTSSLFKLFYSLSAKENFVGFDFSALDFSDPKKLKFLYKLEGVDEDWKDPGEKRFVSYSQLKGGDYKFLLKASGPSGEWQRNPVSVGLQIAKLWYQTIWAKGLFIVLIIAGLLLIYFTRLKQAIAKEKVKAAYERDLAEIKMQALTAQMNPHFIFNSLNSIDFYIIKNDTKKASQYLNRFSRLMRLILKNSRSNYVSLKDDIDALKLYLEIESLRFNHEFSYEVNVDERLDQDYLKIPPMLIQPYVENAIWHGLLHKKANGKIVVNVDYEPEKEMVYCTVLDNGIGRKKSMEEKAQIANERKRKSFGMNITRDKIEAINYLHDMNATVNIIDLYNDQNEGVGTKVELNIPV